MRQIINWGLISSLLICLTFPIRAEEPERFLILGAVSDHGKSEDRDKNEEHIMLGLHNEFTDGLYWNAAIFEDSFEETSVYGAVGRTWSLGSDFIRGGFAAGVLSRNDLFDQKPGPFVVPVLRIGNQRAGVITTYLPLDRVLFLQLVLGLE